MTAAANPAYAARRRGRPAADGAVRVRRPQPPVVASPVPRLTSLYAVDDPGP
jgi:hypothetical protein